MNEFRDAIKESGLEDIGYRGPWFTWQHGQDAENNIKERLDHCVATKTWSDLFTTYAVSHISTTVSDHLPIFLETRKKVSIRRQLRQKRFRFEFMWVKELECEEIITSTWNERSTTSFFEKDKSTRSNLCQWHTIKFSGMRNIINKLSHALEQV